MKGLPKATLDQIQMGVISNVVQITMRSYLVIIDPSSHEVEQWLT